MAEPQNRPVGRPRIHLDEWADQIRDWQALRWNHDQMRAYIEEATGMPLAVRTFKRKIKEMGLSSHLFTKDSPQLRAVVLNAYSNLRLTDAETVAILALDGFETNVRGLARIRKRMGLRKRVERGDFEAADAQLHELLSQELDTNNISGFGAGNLYTFMRSKYNVVGR